MKLNWHDAPTRTEWGHDMVVTTVALGRDHSVDLYCERSKTAEAEALLHKPWVGLTDEEKSGQRPFGNGLLFNSAEAQAWEIAVDYAEAKLKEKNDA